MAKVLQFGAKFSFISLVAAFMTDSGPVSTLALGVSLAQRDSGLFLSRNLILGRLGTVFDPPPF